MIRILLFLAFVVTVGAGFAWAASLSGELVMMIGNHRIVTSPLTALCVILTLVAVILLIWWLIRMIFHMPHIVQNRFNTQRRERGFQALGEGLIAVMSGDVKSARRLTKQSQKLLGMQSQPLLHLLAAETKRLACDHEGAIEIFHTMCEDPQMRLIGLKGLYREAIKNGEDVQAGRFAAQAAKITPSLEWASHAGIASFAQDGAWEEALLLLDRHEKALTKARARELNLTHWRVVLMCAKARDMAQTDADTARDIAFKAHRLEPDFIPAATIAAQIAFRLGEQRKGSKLIETLWQKTPHPDLAQCYIDASNRSPSEKLRRAHKLARLNPTHYLSYMLVARTAFDAKDYQLAQKMAQSAAQSGAFASVFLLLADIEAALDGNQVKIQKFLASALSAPADPVWIADGQIMAQWVALSPLSHIIGACVWQQPVKAPTILTLDTLPEEQENRQNSADLQAHSVADIVPETIGEAEQHHEASDIKTPPNPPQNAFVVGEKNQLGFLPDVELVDDIVTKDETTPPPLTRIIVDDPGVRETP